MRNLLSLVVPVLLFLLLSRARMYLHECFAWHLACTRRGNRDHDDDNQLCAPEIAAQKT